MELHPMRKFIEDTLAARSEVAGLDGKKIKAFQAQLTFVGSIISGGVTHSDTPGVFLCLTPGKDGRSGQDIMVARYFTAENVLYMDVIVGEAPRVQLATEMPGSH